MKEKRERKTSCYKGICFAEEVYNPERLDNSFQFVYLDGKDRLPVEKPTIEALSEIISPLVDQNIEKGIILLPSKVEEYETDKELLEIIKNFIHRYVDIEDWFEKLSAYYVMLSYLYDCFDVVPYLRVIGDTGQGKTRFLKTVGSICYKSIFCAGAITPAPIFRFIEMYHGTLVIDEADFKFSDGYQEIIKILNCGYMKGYPVLRCEGNGANFTPKGYDCFSPKIIATRNRFQDLALESRCITYEMRERKRDVPLNLPEEFDKEALEARNKLLLWRLRNYKKIGINNNLMVKGIEDRVNQIMIPLASIIEDKQILEGFQGFMRDYNQRLIEDRGMTQEAEVFGIICEFLEEEKETPTIKEITSKYSQKYEINLSEIRRITPKKVGSIIRNKLKFKTERDREGYRLVPNSEQVEVLKRKYAFSLSTSLPPK